MPPYDSSLPPTAHHTSSLYPEPPYHLPSDPSRLAPEDAYYTQPPPHRSRQPALGSVGATTGSVVRPLTEVRRKIKERSRSRKKTAQWKKLLWVEQQYPDNYTDEQTFLHELKRNPSFQQYEFWPLMADATVIVQHLSSVAIFICCFVGIIQERVSPVTVVGSGSLSTFFGWLFWDYWVSQEELAEKASFVATEAIDEASSVDERAGGLESTRTAQSADREGLFLNTDPSITKMPGQTYEYKASTASEGSSISTKSMLTTGHPTGASSFATYSHFPPPGDSVSSLSPRNQQRLATAKSATLIYCALLGLSPILKSLTKSTTSDSIWAMSCWLMCINVFFFDYGGAVGAKFTASLSTNAALMASTVLASRLPSTTHVFSLTLFSIEVFGLFPVFRRYLRHISWKGNFVLTIVLVVGASGGVGVTVSGGAWTAAFVGIILGGITTFLTMGICSWWLIGLQKYKNEIHGPWDPARPIIRRRWD
ncbi:GPI2-domain-containing protein [Pseudovirgaria hyperparasitica]|uniref:GPI2-domain-containing protein n=1 Tax=Pseudovirgaria hyperparasitica TaxID=470096 RepID=A0A6A6W6E2_9PEZI|nr:GPI2-domain-containing protein [Pseudovirgaria hyperparasitica]KAF2757530.1 GPI2-domain-containing protein [Pseudovirgaria hyperparasitica]